MSRGATIRCCALENFILQSVGGQLVGGRGTGHYTSAARGFRCAARLASTSAGSPNSWRALRRRHDIRYAGHEEGGGRVSESNDAKIRTTTTAERRNRSDNRRQVYTIIIGKNLKKQFFRRPKRIFFLIVANESSRITTVWFVR